MRAGGSRCSPGGPPAPPAAPASPARAVGAGPEALTPSFILRTLLPELPEASAYRLGSEVQSQNRRCARVGWRGAGWAGANAVSAPSATGYAQGRRKSADARLCFKLGTSCGRGGRHLLKAFRSLQRADWAWWHGTSCSRNPPPGNQKSSLPSFFLSGIASNHTLLTCPYVQRQNHPDNQSKHANTRNTREPRFCPGFLQTFVDIQALPFPSGLCIL